MEEEEEDERPRVKGAGREAPPATKLCLDVSGITSAYRAGIHASMPAGHP